MRIVYSFGAKGEHLASANARVRRIKRPITRVRELLFETAERLGSVLIEQRDFAEILDRYGSAEKFFYLDPPYVSFQAIGRYSPLAPERRADLFARLAKLKGRFLLSFDNCAEIRDRAKEHGFKAKAVNVRYTICGAHRATKTPELLISNYRSTALISRGQG